MPQRVSGPRAAASLLCALAVLAASPGAEAADTAIDGATDGAISLSAAEATALAVSVVPARSAATLGIDGLVGSIELPLTGTTVVAAAYGGRIAQIGVDEGERVSAGQILAVVDSRDYAADRARLMALRSRAHTAQLEAERDRILAREGIIATSRAAASAAAARELAGARDALAATVDAIAQASPGGTLSRFELRAPTDGVVVRRHVMTGERIDSLAPAFVLAASTAWRIEVHVPVAVSHRLGRGAQLRLGELAIPITGRGLSLDEQTQTVVVRGQLPADSGFVPGQQITASLQLPAPAGALEVPRSALVREADTVGVFLARDGRYRFVPVTVLAESAGTAVVEASLVAGDPVVSRGVSALKSLLKR